MFDAVLACFGGFGCSDTVRNVSDEDDVFAPRGLRDREISFAAEQGLNFNEVHATQDPVGGRLHSPLRDC